MLYNAVLHVEDMVPTEDLSTGMSQQSLFLVPKTVLWNVAGISEALPLLNVIAHVTA